MNNEQTNKTDTDGKELVEDLQNAGQHINEYDKALALVKKREEMAKIETEILERKEKLAANEMLAGTSGGAVETKQLSPEDQKTEAAAKFFKGTSLEKAIKPDEKK